MITLTSSRGAEIVLTPATGADRRRWSSTPSPSRHGQSHVTSTTGRLARGQRLTRKEQQARTRAV